MNRPGCSITINPQKTQGAILQTWRHFPGPHETKVYQNTLGSCSPNYFKNKLSTFTTTRLHRVRWSPFADISTPATTPLDVYLLSLSRTDLPRVRRNLVTSTRLRWSPFADIFHPATPLDVNFLSLSQTDSLRNRWNLVMATRLHRIRWSPFGDIFHPSHNTTLMYIY